MLTAYTLNDRIRAHSHNAAHAMEVPPNAQCQTRLTTAQGREACVDGSASLKGQTIGGIVSVLGLVVLILAFGFVGALMWLMPR